MQLRKPRVVVFVGVAILGILVHFFGKPAYLLMDAWLHGLGKERNTNPR